MTERHLFVSFWHIGLANLPAGTFTHRCVPAAEAKRAIDEARSAGRLSCAVGKDILAPYEQRERRNHESLCRVLGEQYGIQLSVDDFLSEEEDMVAARPLIFAEVSGSSRIIVIDCLYAMAKGGDRSLEFEIDPSSVTFHVFESVGASDTG